jgi:hypothetical protein
MEEMNKVYGIKELTPAEKDEVKKLKTKMALMDKNMSEIKKEIELSKKAFELLQSVSPLNRKIKLTPKQQMVYEELKPKQ